MNKAALARSIASRSVVVAIAIALTPVVGCSTDPDVASLVASDAADAETSSDGAMHDVTIDAGLVDAPIESASEAATEAPIDAPTDATTDAPTDATSPPAIASFTSVASACAGSSVALKSDFSGGVGVIEPGAIAVAPGSAVTDVTLAATTTFTLTVTGSGAPAVATVSVTANASPDATVTAPATARVGDTALAASVVATSGATYAWSVLSGNATIASGAATAAITFDVTASGAEVTLQVVVSAGGCSSTNVAHVAMPCSPPVLASLDRSVVPAVAAYLPNNENTRPFDVNASGDVWAPLLVHKATSGSAIFDFGFTQSLGAAWSAPAGAPLVLNAATSQVSDVKIAVDDAGDAVLVWTDGVAGSYTAQLRSYRASDGSWSAAQTVGANAIDQGAPIYVRMNRATGLAIVGWLGGTFGAVVPHVRTFTVATQTLGPDLALRATTTNATVADLMDFDLELNDALTGMAVWYEEDATSSRYALYALHFTAGVPDPGATTGYAIATLVQGTSTSKTDALNVTSPLDAGPDQQPRAVAVSRGGDAAVVWKVSNGLATGNAAQLYALRFVGGVWGTTPELVDSQPTAAWTFVDWSIDDAGAVLVATVGPARTSFFQAAAGAAWGPSTLLSVGGSSSPPYVVSDAASGRAIVTYVDIGGGARGVLRGAFHDPTTLSLGPSFTIDDPTQSTTQSGRVVIDATGKATVAYIQTPKPAPVGSNSTNSALEFFVTCQ